MWLTIFNIIKNPKVSGAIVAFAVLVYYQLSLWSLENEVERGNIKIEKLEDNLNTARGNTKKAKAVNEKNKVSIDKCNKGVDSLDKTYIGILKSKDNTIYTLKQTISDLKKPIVYPETIVYKECEFKIKSKDNNEKSDNTFNNLLNVGR